MHVCMSARKGILKCREEILKFRNVFLEKSTFKSKTNVTQNPICNGLNGIASINVRASRKLFLNDLG